MIRKRILTIAKFSSLSFLLGVFLLAIIVCFYTFNRPQSVIDLLQPLIPVVTPAPIKMAGIVVLGDSQSDEYRADDNRGSNYPGYTMNWVELLQKERNVNFGKWGIRDEPRRTGYEYNWARTGATARSMIESGQNTGAADQIREKKVNVVVIFIGANDFSPYITENGYDQIYNDQLSDAAKKSKVNRIIADIKTAVYTVKDAGDVRILLVKIPDWGSHPGIQVAYPFPDQRQNVSDVIQDANTEIDKLAQDEQLQTLDPNEFYQEIFNKGGSGKTTIDGVTLQRLILNNDPHNFYLEDGVHTGTVVNGLLANAIVAKINTMIDNKIKPLSEKEIREAAGI
jgi:lysophospholipase L1-like esterase